MPSASTWPHASSGEAIGTNLTSSGEAAPHCWPAPPRVSPRPCRPSIRRSTTLPSISRTVSSPCLAPLKGARGRRRVDPASSRGPADRRPVEVDADEPIEARDQRVDRVDRLERTGPRIKTASSAAAAGSPPDSRMPRTPPRRGSTATSVISPCHLPEPVHLSVSRRPATDQPVVATGRSYPQAKPVDLAALGCISVGRSSGWGQSKRPAPGSAGAGNGGRWCGI